MLKKFQHFLKKIAIFFIECQDEEGDIRSRSLAVSLIHQLFEVWEFLHSGTDFGFLTPNSRYFIGKVKLEELSETL